MNNVFSNLKLQKSSTYLNTIDTTVICSIFFVQFSNSQFSANILTFYIALGISILVASCYSGAFVKQFYLLPLTPNERKTIAKQNFFTRICSSLLLFLVLNIIPICFTKITIFEVLINAIFFTIILFVQQVNLRAVLPDTLKKLNMKGLFAWHFVLLLYNLCIYIITLELYHDIKEQIYNNSDITIILIMLVIDAILLVFYFVKYYDRMFEILSDYALSSIVTSEVEYANHNRSKK